jgi:hypothetical protein
MEYAASVMTYSVEWDCRNNLTEVRVIKIKMLRGRLLLRYESMRAVDEVCKRKLSGVFDATYLGYMQCWLAYIFIYVFLAAAHNSE